MTEAGWTRGRPTKPGWYWWRDCDCPSDPIIVRVVHDGYGLIVYGLEEYSRRLYETRGEWLGPLTPDSYQQGRVAACVWKHDDTDDYYETACNRGYSLEDGTLEENDHKYCPYCGGLIQLAQQAQGGCDEQNLRR